MSGHKLKFLIFLICEILSFNDPQSLPFPQGHFHSLSRNLYIVKPIPILVLFPKTHSHYPHSYSLHITYEPNQLKPDNMNGIMHYVLLFFDIPNFPLPWKSFPFPFSLKCVLNSHSHRILRGIRMGILWKSQFHGKYPIPMTPLLACLKHAAPTCS